MKYLENAINFLVKNWMLALPLFVLTAIPAIIGGASVNILQMTSMFGNFGDPAYFTDPAKFAALFGALVPLAVGGGLLGLICSLVSMPATYGLINKKLETGAAELNDVGQAISQNFLKFIFYWLGTIIVGIAFCIALFIVMLILGLLTAILQAAGIFLIVIVGIAFFIAGIILAVLLSLWFPAMIVDGLDVVAAAKKSIEIARGSFWTIVGIGILVTIIGAIASGILSFLNIIPLIGPIITSIVPTAVSFIFAVFFLSLYREKTGRINA